MNEEDMAELGITARGDLINLRDHVRKLKFLSRLESDNYRMKKKIGLFN